MALIGDSDFTDLGWICDEAEDDAPARQSPFSPDQSSPDSSLIRRNHVAIPSTVTRLSQTCPLYPSIYIYICIVTSPISFPASEKRTTSSKASVYTLAYFQRSQCNQTGIGQGARRGFDRNSPRQRNCIRFSFTRQLSLIIIEQQSWMLYEQVTCRWIIATSSIPSS